MKKLLILFLILATALGALYAFRKEVQRSAFEALLNSRSREFFQGSVRLKSGYIDRSLKVHLNGLEAILKSEKGPVPLSIGSIYSENRLTDYFSPKGVSLRFDGVKPQESSNAGLRGRAELKSQDGGSFHLETKIEGLDLKEIEWVNQDNLKGSSGLITGGITSDGKFTEAPQFKVILMSKDGLVQSKFFGMLVPYLPALPTKDKMVELAKTGAVIPFKDAAVRFELTDPQKIKIFLHIQVPDYNIELNINFEIHIDNTLSFSELVQVMGLVKVKS